VAGFKDSVQQALQTSTTVHTTKSIFCSFSALLIYASFITEVINQISSSADQISVSYTSVYFADTLSGI